MRKQVIENLSQVAPPGEQFVACAHCETGLNPWLAHLAEQIPFVGGVIGIAIYSMRSYYFITLTNTSIVVNRAGRMANRPKEVVVAMPIGTSPIQRIKKGVVWSRMYFQFPGQEKPTRLNFHRIWNADIDKFIIAMPHAVEGSQDFAAFAPVPQQQIAGAEGNPQGQRQS
jgi:hypothetical protein